MYYPIQIPYILNKEFNKYFKYKEEIIEEVKDFSICLWEIFSTSKSKDIINNIIIPDACIDLIVDYNSKQIGFAGMSKTVFNFELKTPYKSFGLRLKPGSFYQLTNIPAKKAMDNFIPINEFDKNFSIKSFFNLDYSNCKKTIINYIKKLSKDKNQSEYMLLFEKFCEVDNSFEIEEIYKSLNLSQRQIQRLFLKNFGINPKMILNIIRFQKSLNSLMSNKIKIEAYYDQAHYIKDIKKNLGITPLDLIKKYK